MSKALANISFDHGLRTEQIIHLGTMCSTQPMADVAVEAFQEYWDEMWQALGLTQTPHEVDDESISSELMMAGRYGFLVWIGTPVPQSFTQDGSYLFFDGHFQMKWFYGETLEAVFDAAAVWQERYVEEKRAEEMSKEAANV